ncbi:MAG: hypothetical protein ABIO06_08115 [Pseudolysinimonas sp.]
MRIDGDVKMPIRLHPDPEKVEKGGAREQSADPRGAQHGWVDSPRCVPALANSDNASGSQLAIQLVSREAVVGELVGRRESGAPANRRQEG